MSKIKKIINLSLIIVLLGVSSMLMSSCSLLNLFSGLFDDNSLSAPVITLNEEAKTISWSGVDDATSYNIYYNDTKTTNPNITQSDETYSFNYSTLSLSDGIYRFYVTAQNSSGVLSSSSNVVIISIGENVKIATLSEDIINYNEDNGLVVTYEDDGVAWENLTGATKYYIIIFSNSLGTEYLEVLTNINYYALSQVSTSEIVCARVGAEVGGTIYVDESLYFYNPDYSVANAEYSSNDDIYLFDGYVNDYYIESFDELSNLVYYNFVNRVTSYNFRLSTTYANSIIANQVGSGTDAKVEIELAGLYNSSTKTYSVYGALQSVFETCSYATANGGKFTRRISSTAYDYNVGFSFYGVTECDTSITTSNTTIQSTPTNNQKIFTDGERSSDYDNFASDNKLLYTSVTSSEELYWAVENQVKPVFSSNDCRAKIIYDEAKNVLREIINDNMTDYDKALAIFDWIAQNTQYDHNSYATDDFTKNCCFYLEGVFINHLAVCDGFSKAYSLMCNMEGIECIRIVGYCTTGGQTGGHAWNKIIIDGTCYVCDITWTEIIFSVSIGYNEYMCHQYFLVSENKISADHTTYTNRAKFWLDKYDANTEYNYYSTQSFGKDGTKLFDLYINNNAEATALFEYALENEWNAIEVVFSNTYVLSGTWANSFLYNTLKYQKVDIQYINTVNSASASAVSYGQNQYGYWLYIEFNLLVDTSADVTSLLDFMNDYDRRSYDIIFDIDTIAGSSFSGSVVEFESYLTTYLDNIISHYSSLYNITYVLDITNSTMAESYDGERDGYIVNVTFTLTAKS